MARTKFGSHLAFVADQLISGFVMAPLTVGYWRGTWQLIQQYMFPDNLGKSSWISLAIGNCGILLLALFQVPIQKLLKRDSLRTPSDVIAWLLGYHVYNYVMAFCIVNLWRGTWDLWNFYTGTEPWSNACCVSIGLILLLLLRANKNCMGTPVIVSHDTDPDFFIVTTRFNSKPAFHEKFIWDCVLTVLIIHNLVVFYWRGTWQLMDNYWSNDDPPRTVWISLATGYGIYLACIPLQLLANAAYKWLSKSGFHKIFLVIVEDMVILVGNFAAVAIWRAIWYGCDQHIWPENPVTSMFFTHSVGIVGLWILRCGHSVIPRGCFVDGDAPQGLEGAAMFPNLYIRQFMKECSKCNTASKKSSSYGSPKFTEHSSETKELSERVGNSQV